MIVFPGNFMVLMNILIIIFLVYFFKKDRYVYERKCLKILLLLFISYKFDFLSFLFVYLIKHICFWFFHIKKTKDSEFASLTGFICREKSVFVPMPRPVECNTACKVLVQWWIEEGHTRVAKWVPPKDLLR